MINEDGQPQSPYGAPPQAPYGVPPFQQPGYGYAAPPVAPLPLGEAIRQLPRQYIRVLIKPSATTFAQEQGKAAWNIIWTQLLALSIITGVFVFVVVSPYLPTTLSSVDISNSPNELSTIIDGSAINTAISSTIFTLLGFFIIVGTCYLIAKAFGGQGTFLAQSYSTALFYVPLNIVIFVSRWIPLVGNAVLIYEIVLSVSMIMAVHRLSRGKAIVVVLSPFIVLVVLLCVLFFLIISGTI